MSLLGEVPLSREKVFRASIAVLLSLGMTACGGNDQPEGYPSPIPAYTSGPALPPCGSTLETFSVEENDDSGGATIVNDGFCVNVYGPEDDGPLAAPIGQLPTDRRFDVDCYDAAETTFVSKVDGEPYQLIALSDEAIKDLNGDPAARKIARC